MKKKFTRAMVCSEFKSKCGSCPLHSCNNPKSLLCWLLDESDIQNIMEDYPYADVKVRMMFNDIETRLTAVEKKVENNVSVEFKPERVVFGGFSAEVVDKKLYDKLEVKHEADCRLISAYDLENKRLKNKSVYLEAEYDKLKEERDKYKELFHSLNHKHQKIVGETKCWKERAIEAEKNEEHLKKRLERPDKLRTALERENNALRATLEAVTKDRDKINSDYYIAQENLKTTNENLKKTEEKYNNLLKDYKLLSESNNNHAKDSIELEGELEAKLRNQRTNLASLQEKYEDACKMNKMREDVYYQNQILAENIKAKDREICLLRSKISTIEDHDDNYDYDGLD